MKKTVNFQFLLFSFLLIAFVSATEVSAQKLRQLDAKCPDGPATVRSFIRVTDEGNIELNPCLGKQVLINGSPMDVLFAGDKGDVSIASGVWTIDNGVVTEAKLSSAVQTKLNTVAGGGVPDASQTTAGKMLTSAPVAGTPVALVESDDRVSQEFPLSKFASFAAALDALDNDANKKILVIASNVQIAADTTIPAMIKLRREGQGKITLTGGDNAELSCAGNCIADPLSTEPLFYGFDIPNAPHLDETPSLRFTGADYPQQLSANLFDTGDADISKRMTLASAALAGKNAEIIIYDNNSRGDGYLFRGAVKAGHTVTLQPGVYENVYDRNGSNNEFYKVPFQMASNSHIVCKPGAVIYDSSVPEGLTIINAYGSVQWLYDDHLGNPFYTSAMNGGFQVENISVTGCHFKGHPNQTNVAQQMGTISLGASKNVSIYNNTFDDIMSFAANDGASALEYNWSEDWTVRDNKFLNCGIQPIGIINARNFKLTDNHFQLRNPHAAGSFVLIDLEPNVTAEMMDGIYIERNSIDARMDRQYTVNAANVSTTNHTVTVKFHEFNSGENVSFYADSGNPAHNPTFQKSGAPYTGLLYVIVEDNNRIKFASTQPLAYNGTSDITITGAGTGNHRLGNANTLVSAIQIIGHGTPYTKNIFIRDNTLIGNEPEWTRGHGLDYLTAANSFLAGTGMESIVVEGNYIKGVKGNAIDLVSVRDAVIKNNTCQSCANAGGASAIKLTGVTDSEIEGNVLKGTYGLAPGAVNIVEEEAKAPAEALGDALQTFVGNQTYPFYPWLAGLNVKFNAAEYTVASQAKDFWIADSDITFGTPTTFNKTNHNLVTGQMVQFIYNGARFGLLDTGYFVYKVNNDSFRLTNTQAQALAGTNFLAFSAPTTNVGANNYLVQPTHSIRLTTSAGTKPKLTFNAANVSGNQINFSAAHGINDGASVYYEAPGGAIGGLVNYGYYYANVIDGDSIELETTAGAGAITFSSTGGSNQTISLVVETTKSRNSYRGNKTTSDLTGISGEGITLAPGSLSKIERFLNDFDPLGTLPSGSAVALTGGETIPQMFANLQAQFNQLIPEPTNLGRWDLGCTSGCPAGWDAGTSILPGGFSTIYGSWNGTPNTAAEPKSGPAAIYPSGAYWMTGYGASHFTITVGAGALDNTKTHVVRLHFFATADHDAVDHRQTITVNDGAIPTLTNFRIHDLAGADRILVYDVEAVPVGGNITIKVYPVAGDDQATIHGVELYFTNFGAAGNDKCVQFNDGNGFGCDSGFDYTKATDTLSVGSVLSKKTVTVKTVNYTVTATESGSVLTNEGTTVKIDYILPPAAAGLTFTFVVQDADGLRAVAASGDTLRSGSSVSAAAGNLDSTAVGSTVTIVAINATEWIATSTIGTWTVN